MANIDENAFGNYVEYDNIFVTASLDCDPAERNRFYNRVARLVAAKSRIAADMCARGAVGRPVIHIQLSSPDTGDLPDESRRFFNLIDRARAAQVIVETTLYGPAGGWQSNMAILGGTPGFRNMYSDSYHFYYHSHYDPKTGQTTYFPEKIILRPRECLQLRFCDHVFLANGVILSR